jgi:hypothetical protein
VVDKVALAQAFSESLFSLSTSFHCCPIFPHELCGGINNRHSTNYLVMSTDMLWHYAMIILYIQFNHFHLLCPHPITVEPTDVFPLNFL